MTDAEFIEALGNTSYVAHELGRDRRVVSNWKSRKIPISVLPRLVAMAKQQGVEVPERITQALAEIRAHYEEQPAAG